MRFQAIIQLILVGLSLAMIFFVVRPEFNDVQSAQEEVEKFKNAADTASQFNARLQELQSRAASLSTNNLSALETYLPSSIDTLAVSRDIAAIAEQNQLTVQAISVAESDSNQSGQNQRRGQATDAAPETNSLQDQLARARVTSQFTLEALGTYDQMKAALEDYERNHYPLRLVELEVAPGAGDSQLFTFVATFETYAVQSE